MSKRIKMEKAKREKAEVKEFKELLKKYKYFKETDVYGSKLRLFYRHLGGFVALKLAKTKITPNQLTLLDFFLFLLAAFLFYLGYPFAIYGAITLFVAVVLDKADGGLARIKKQETKIGRWLDSIVGTFAIFILILAIAFEAYRVHDGLAWLFAFFTITAFFFVKVLYLLANDYLPSAKLSEYEKKEHRWRSSLHFTDVFILTGMILAGLFNAFYEFLIFCSIYGWLFYFGMFAFLTLKIIKLKEK